MPLVINSLMVLPFMGASTGSYVMLIMIVLIMYISLYRFSRKIVWLEVLTTNNDPNVVLVSYLLAVLQNNGIVRCALLLCMLPS